MNAVATFIRGLPKPVEFAIVIGVAFGWPILGSLQIALSEPLLWVYASSAMREVMIWEIIILFLLGWFLFVRGWDFARQPIYPSLPEVTSGLALACAILIAWSLIWQAMVAVGLAPVDTSHVVFEKPDWPTLIAVSVVNPIFEELFVCAYVITALRGWTGVVVSIAIRAAYHTYQGLDATIYVALIGLIFALWFVRTGKLWPVIIAHMAWDFIPLLLTGDQ